MGDDERHAHTDGGGSGHDHAHAHGSSSTTRLGGAAAVNVGFAVVQVAVGLALASVAVLADAAHQVVDAVGLVTALVALVLARRPATDEMSFGWGKADALGGLVSGLLLLVSVAWIVWEAIGRLSDPAEVSGAGVIAIGVAGIVVNGGSVLLVGHGHELSVKAARLHLLADLLGSVIVVATGALLAAGVWDGVDPVASLLLSALVVHATWRLLRQASDELLDRAPGSATPADVRAALADLPGIADVHHVHSRSLGGGRLSVTAHVVVDGRQSLHAAQSHIGEVSRTLAERLGVAHTTLQLECHDCDDDGH